MRNASLAIGVLALAMLLMCSQLANAKPDYTRRTSKECSFCHRPPGYNVTEAGT
jgi:hypothetical protein